MLIIGLQDKTLTIETRLVTEVLEYEHLIEPAAGVPSIQADWAPLAMSSGEAHAVYDAAKRAFRAPESLTHIHATKVRIVPAPELSDVERALRAKIGATHAAIEAARIAEGVRAAEEAAAEAARLDAERAAEEFRKLADEQDGAKSAEHAADVPPVDPAPLDGERGDPTP